jgi:hypothetical protein
MSKRDSRSRGMLVERTAGPSTSLPWISCRGWWLRRTSCAFLYGKAHTRPCPVLRGRKSGYAPVGMTNLFLPRTLSGEGRVNCRSLGYARDDKGEGGASIGCSGGNESLADLVHPSLNLPQASCDARDDKGRGELPFSVMVVMTTSQAKLQRSDMRNDAL